MSIEKKPSRVGQSNGLWGLIIAFSIPFFTITAIVPAKLDKKGVPEGVFAKVARVVSSHPPFFVFLGMVCLVGGVAIGRLMRGGKTIGNAGNYGDLDGL